MNEEITIAKATIEDIPAIVLLVNSAYRGDSSKKGWTTEADLLDGVRVIPETMLEQMNTHGQYFLKALDQNGIIIGCVSLLEKSKKVYLGMLTVDPNIQAAGIGKVLMNASEDFARKLGKTNIEMTVISVRAELIAYYERRGYQLTGEKRPFPNDPKFGIQKQPLEFVVMEKYLV
ncbi:MAG: GNAT family N-acetyltransferase [Bacteroidetes bacterium 24-39-8]|jgi:N-acetylglutamate synthase-like GNAT family acetyltransferase|nr:MAG: GNAT family N-acetyltransferase [Sphingobacteriia bacterium 35-40-5]OYZ50124.1 MAG: GNAT family N-acetyltransferase [Bacteroidetes bacterium 24-39-8]OZA66861.1 MAG: GNAT family N-acetyltransferase [Sphingobacteriia bacterium 39-39-8]HQR93111.1 GNAT family N-acetyltransferase [Sediminibacterium sp.]HQS55906.1 GNAT family N-acetyltransferase [Sediminibacterium sp.]